MTGAGATAVANLLLDYLCNQCIDLRKDVTAAFNNTSEGTLSLKCFHEFLKNGMVVELSGARRKMIHEKYLKSMIL
jgi:hypothetical protein